MKTKQVKKERSAEFLFNEKVFKCSYPLIHSRTTEDIERHGVVLNSNFNSYSEIRSVMEEEIVGYISIKAMVEFYNKGISFTIMKMDDVHEVVHIGRNYLNEKSNKLQFGYNNKNEPIELFMEISEFIEMLVVRYEKYISPTAKVKGDMIDRLIKDTSGITPYRKTAGAASPKPNTTHNSTKDKQQHNIESSDPYASEYREVFAKAFSRMRQSNDEGGRL